MSGCALKHGSKTHSSMRQSNSKPLNEAPLISCWIQAVEHRKCAAGLSGARFARSNLAKLHKSWEFAWSSQENFRFFAMYKSPETFSFPFSLLRHYQMPECFYDNNCCFWSRATVPSCYRNWQCSQWGHRLRCCSAIADKINSVVSHKVNYRGTQSWTWVVDERSAKRDGFWT